MATKKKASKKADQQTIALLDSVAASLDRRQAVRATAFDAANQAYSQLLQSEVHQAFQAAKAEVEQKLRDEQTVFETVCEMAGVDPSQYQYDAEEKALVRLADESAEGETEEGSEEE